MRENRITKRTLIVAALAVTAFFGYAIALFGANNTTNLSSRDSSFLKDAAQGGMEEVKLGQLAQQNGASERVKQFGEHMVKDHTAMGDDVKSVAASDNVDLPSDIGLKAKASYKMLEMKKGADFDKAYMSAMIKDHKNDIAAFQKEANSGKDPNVKALASKALPKLREHLQMAENVARDLGIAAQ